MTTRLATVNVSSTTARRSRLVRGSALLATLPLWIAGQAADSPTDINPSGAWSRKVDAPTTLLVTETANFQRVSYDGTDPVSTSNASASADVHADTRPPDMAAGNLADGQEFARFTTLYYLHPQPERVAEAIRSLGATGLAPNQQAGPKTSPFVNWFSEVYLRNPNHQDEWRKLIAGQRGPERVLLDTALVVAGKGGMLNIPGLPPAPGWNDWYWAGFFASGNPLYIQKLIDELPLIDNRQDRMVYFAGATAEWSLSSNAQQHPTVRRIVQDARTSADPRTAQLIDELLQKDPTQIRADAIATARTIPSPAPAH